MTTKDQERKALEQIGKIIESLGPESYIAKAFEGCDTVAIENIDNDFWDSYKDRYERRDWEAVQTEKTVVKLRDEVEEANKEAQKWHDRYDLVVAKKNEYHDESIKNWNMFREQEDKVAALELEIIKLKARLFDLLDK